MAKTVTFTYDKKNYVLEYNRSTIKWLESKGVKPEELGDKIITSQELLFKGAFRMHHIDTKDETIEDIWYAIDDKTGLLSKLVEMYGETLETLIGSKGNVKWEAVE